MPEPVGPERSSRSKWILAGAVVFLIAFGLGLGLVLGGNGDDASDGENAASTDTVVEDEGDQADEAPDATEAPDDTAPEDLAGETDSLQDMLDNLPEGWEEMLPDGMLDDLSNLGDLEDFELPDGMSSVQVTLLFESDAPPRRVEAIQQEFEDSELISLVQFLSADEVADLTGIDLPPGFQFDTLSAFGSADADPDETRDFACSFADDPGVESVQVLGADPCGATT